ncbi:uncharacterized protein LOC122508706 isoform X2 [Leptopilina heterotoma]|uniref:uncharacterized protein LOC122508706 isoform X2 n=1 Tax=Leptopilina heterotoma TaxID=63436 RepID=UPI001CA99620|nr:uncharacterized protein LOC122508706 isoform X2 [Leptopilina heterotoma]
MFIILNICPLNIITENIDDSILLDLIKNDCPELLCSSFSPEKLRILESFLTEEVPCRQIVSQLGLPDEDNKHTQGKHFPYKEKEGKVELWPESNVWIDKHKRDEIMEFNYKKPGIIMKDVLENLIGENKLHLFSSKLEDPKKLPIHVKNATFQFIKNYFKTKNIDLKDSSLSQTLSYFLRRGIKCLYTDKHKRDEMMKLHFKHPGTLIKNILENLIGINELHLFSSRLQYPKKLPANVREAIFQFVKNHFKTKNIDLKDSSLRKTLSDFLRRGLNRLSIEKKYDKPIQGEQFPYEEKEGKVELWPESNVWIDKHKLDEMMKFDYKKAGILMRNVLENLIGKNELHLFSSKLEYPKKLPANVREAIFREFLKNINFFALLKSIKQQFLLLSVKCLMIKIYVFRFYKELF